jgi:hypothetical protein
MITATTTAIKRKKVQNSIKDRISSHPKDKLKYSFLNYKTNITERL